MKIIQNFSSQSHITKLPLTEIILWYYSVAALKRLGYKTKIYCKSEDIKFLKKYKLLDFYDEVDTQVLNHYKPEVNETYFWSTRKLVCIQNEFKINKNPFIYMDTDVVLKRCIQWESDLLVWSAEVEPAVYLPWEYFSLPPNVKLDPFLIDVNKAYNCGVLAFKSKEQFDLYLNSYYKFTKNNPCKLAVPKLADYFKRTYWACNAEQRILRGVSNYYNWEVTRVDLDNVDGRCKHGIHYFRLKQYWRLLSIDIPLTSTSKLKIIKDFNSSLKGLLAKLPEGVRNIFLEDSPELKDLWLNNTLLTKYI
jgi:hypothetical protein